MRELGAHNTSIFEKEGENHSLLFIEISEITIDCSSIISIFKMDYKKNSFQINFSNGWFYIFKFDNTQERDEHFNNIKDLK